MHFVWQAKYNRHAHQRCQEVQGSSVHVKSGWFVHVKSGSSVHVAFVQLLFTWQAWYFWDWAGSGDALGPAAAPRHFAWQAWHLMTSAVVSRGRRGTG